MHTHTHKNTDDTKFNLHTTWAANRFETDEVSSTEPKTWQVYSFGWKRNVLRFDLNKSMEIFCQRGRGRSLHIEGPKTEKAREPTVESGMREESQHLKH